MVYIHGGANATGSGSSPLYDAARCAGRGDVVVVTLNHRLNLFGYLYLARLDARFPDSGNAGMLDLVLALQWVRDNIARFGGDPSRVMLFGQSGGGAKIATLLAMPAAAGLFHSAATMSGQQLTARPATPRDARAELLEAPPLRGLSPDALATVPFERLLEASGATDPIIGAGSLYSGPVLDQRHLLRHPFYPDAPPQSAHIPMIIGNTHDETRGLIGRDPSAWTLDWNTLPARLEREMRVDIDPRDPLVREYRRMHRPVRRRCVLCRHHGVAQLARRHRRGGTARRAARTGVDLPARFPLAAGRRQAGARSTLTTSRWLGMLDRARHFHCGSAGYASRIAADGRRLHRTGAQRQSQPRRAAALATLCAAGARDDGVRPGDATVNDPRGGERRLFERVPFIQQGDSPAAMRPGCHFCGGVGTGFGGSFGVIVSRFQSPSARRPAAWASIADTRPPRTGCR